MAFGPCEECFEASGYGLPGPSQLVLEAAQAAGRLRNPTYEPEARGPGQVWHWILLLPLQTASVWALNGPLERLPSHFHPSEMTAF